MKAFLLIYFLFICQIIYSQNNIKIIWQKSLGGTKNDIVKSIQETDDKGYIVAGTTESVDENVIGNHGSDDFWILKLNKAGNIKWKYCYGGSKLETTPSIKQTFDKGYIVVGTTESNDGDVRGNHGSVDVWVLKLNSDGQKVWQKCFGGSGADWGSSGSSTLEGGTSIQQTKDGGYIVAGTTSSNDGDVKGNHGGSDYWILKLDKTGVIQWQRCFGGSTNEYATSVKQLKDGGYIVAGYSNSIDGDVVGQHSQFSENDFWIIRLNKNGNLKWQKCLGGTLDEEAHDVIQTADNGFLVIGHAMSTDGDLICNQPFWSWVIKLDSSSNIQWQRTFTGATEIFSVKETKDNGYIIAGKAQLNDGVVSGVHFDSLTQDYNWDFWTLKLNNKGYIQWQKCLGSSKLDMAFSIEQTTDGDYITAGLSTGKDGDANANHGLDDFWIVKYGADLTNYFIETFPLCGTSFCPSEQLVLDYSATGVFKQGNFFTAQLSNSKGSFTSPKDIGKITSTTSGSINVTLPSNGNGNNYRIRVISSLPPITGSNNGTGFEIKCSSPTNLFADSITTSTAFIHWDTIQCAIGYTYHYRRLGSTTWLAFSVYGSAVELISLQSNNTYEWSAKTDCDGYSSSYSPITSFTTKHSTSTSSLNTSTSNFGFKVYPNPSSSKFTIQFNQYKIQQINIYNLLGKLVKTYKKIISPMIVDLSELKSGVYFIDFISDEGKETQKIIKQ